MKHVAVVHERCRQYNCPVCDGGLYVCSVCNGAESSLPSDCPGTKMSAAIEHAVFLGAVDYIGGQWFLRNIITGFSEPVDLADAQRFAEHLDVPPRSGVEPCLT